MRGLPASRGSWLMLAALLSLVATWALPAVAKEPGSLAEWRLPGQPYCCVAAPAGRLAVSNLGAAGTTLRSEFPVQTRDAAGLRRDTAYFMGYQFAAVAILYAMPESVTNWSEEDKSDYSLSKWWDNVQDPGMDSDDFYLNWIIHPYWGASYFVRARERGYSNTESFWYSVLLSTMFEYGAEALAEEPSYQDLVITPVLGSLVGIWFMDVRDGVRERTYTRGFRSTGDQWIWVLTDPLGGLNRQVDRLFGREADVTLQPWVATMRPYGANRGRQDEDSEDTVLGLRLTLNW